MQSFAAHMPLPLLKRSHMKTRNNRANEIHAAYTVQYLVSQQQLELVNLCTYTQTDGQPENNACWIAEAYQQQWKLDAYQHE